MRLAELTGAYRELMDLADDGEDVSAALANIDDALETKASAIIHVLKELDADVAKFVEEEKRLAARRKALEANAQRLRDYVKRAMSGAGVLKLSAGTCSLSLRDGPERVVVQDEHAVPEVFLRVKVEVDRSKILAAYKADGEVVRGTMIERSVCLHIR